MSKRRKIKKEKTYIVSASVAVEAASKKEAQREGARILADEVHEWSFREFDVKEE